MSTIEFRSPDAGFDQPVGMWLACHQRVQRFSRLLPRLARHVQEHGADEEAQTTATSIRRYFNEAAPRHHEDEEVDMFPRLRERLHAETDQSVLEVLDQVEDEHLAMTGLWNALDAGLARIARGTPHQLERAAIDHFQSMYQHHIEAEERVLLPALQRVLGQSDWEAIGRAMAERRGLEWPGPTQPAARSSPSS